MIEAMGVVRLATTFIHADTAPPTNTGLLK